VEIPFLQSDDFDLMFKISDYNKMKSEKTLSYTYSYLKQIERFKSHPYVERNYDYYINGEGRAKLNLQTKWVVWTFNGNAIALLSTYDSDRFAFKRPYFEGEMDEGEYANFRVSSLEEGLVYLKDFKADIPPFANEY
jgi:hypothetical protein